MIKAGNGRILSESIKLLFHNVSQSEKASEILKIKWSKRDKQSHICPLWNIKTGHM